MPNVPGNLKDDPPPPFWKSSGWRCFEYSIAPDLVSSDLHLPWPLTPFPCMTFRRAEGSSVWFEHRICDLLLIEVLTSEDKSLFTNAWISVCIVLTLLCNFKPIQSVYEGFTWPYLFKLPYCHVHSRGKASVLFAIELGWLNTGCRRNSLEQRERVCTAAILASVGILPIWFRHTSVTITLLSLSLPCLFSKVTCLSLCIPRFYYLDFTTFTTYYFTI